jgi:hypothetical protein
MKKRDLYFSLHVERVGIASHQSKSENVQRVGSEPELQPQHYQYQEQKAVARVTVMNWENEYVLDSFVAIPVPVSDFYDTGIRPEYVQTRASESPNNTSADESRGEANSVADTTDGSSCSFAAVRAKVERILRGKILIGYELEEGLKALGLSHPNTDTRDCSVYFCNNEANMKTGENLNPLSSAPSLEELSKKELNRPFNSAKATISKDNPNNSDGILLTKDSSISQRPVQNCVTAMDLYKTRRNEWETALISQARDRERQQQNYLLKISQQRQQAQQQQAQQQQAQQQQAQQQAQQQQSQQLAQQQYRESMTSISLHCETVRTALSGRTKTIARITIVDGPSRNVLLDEFAQIPVPVTDFCETGITDKDVMVGNSSNGNEKSFDAPASKFSMPLSVLRGHAERLLRGRLLVGYKLEESLKALGLTHHCMQVRDIAYFPPFLHNKVVGGSTSVVTVRSLDDLSEEFLRRPLRALGDRFRPVDLCQSALALYETFRDQWERHAHSQQQDVFVRRQNQQQQVHHPHHLQGRMVSPSMQLPHLRHNQFYGLQSRADTYGTPRMVTRPSQQQQQQQLLPQRQVLVPEQQQQQHYSDLQSRSNSNNSHWFPWVKQQPQQQNSIIAASQTLSTQAFQVLQEDSCEQASFSPKNHFFPVTSHHESFAFDERKSSYDGSAYGGGSEFSGLNSESFATESVVSSMLEETSSVISGDQACYSPTVHKVKFLSSPSPSSLPSSWFRFGLKKPKDSTLDETMEAVKETELLTDDDMLPRPTTLFPPSQDSQNDAEKDSKKTDEGAEDEVSSDSSSKSPLMPRTWFGFRKSPVPKDRSRSPSTSRLESKLEDLSIAARPEGLADTATEASIEIMLSIPASAESDDKVSPLAEKPATTSLSSRPSSSWFGFRRLSKTGTKANDLNTDPLGKGFVESKMPCHPELLPAPTERTTAMDEDWLQEFMSQSSGTAQEFEPWMNGTGEASPRENTDKPLSTSRGQASWFGFKRSKAPSSNKTSPIIALDATISSFEAGTSNNNETWSDGAATSDNWLPEEGSATFSLNSEHRINNNIDDIFHTRARLSTESTIPSVTTEEQLEEEDSRSESYSNDLDFGAAQSFNFLKI